jgi:hypothetical protein
MHTHAMALDQEDAELLLAMLDYELSDLPSEVRHTDKARLRDELRARAHQLKDLRDRLRHEFELTV